MMDETEAPLLVLERPNHPFFHPSAQEARCPGRRLLFTNQGNEALAQLREGMSLHEGGKHHRFVCLERT